EPGSLTRGPLDGAGAQVGAMDDVAALGQPDRLGADATGAVEDTLGRRSEPGGDQAIEDLPLPPDGLLPVGEEQVVVAGEPIVEGSHRLVHAPTSPKQAAHPGRDIASNLGPHDPLSSFAGMNSPPPPVPLPAFRGVHWTPDPRSHGASVLRTSPRPPYHGASVLRTSPRPRTRERGNPGVTDRSSSPGGVRGA